MPHEGHYCCLSRGTTVAPLGLLLIPVCSKVSYRRTRGEVGEGEGSCSTLGGYAVPLQAL